MALVPLSADKLCLNARKYATTQNLRPYQAVFTVQEGLPEGDYWICVG